MQPLDVENTQDGLLLSDAKEGAARRRVLTGSMRQRTTRWLVALSLIAAISLILSAAALAAALRAASSTTSITGPGSADDSPTTASWGQIRRVAFSSCTSYDVRPQPIWTKGVIPSRPDAWVWLGDLAYFDDPLINCNVVPDHPQCNCTADFMRRPPFQCFAGNVDHARLRVQLQLAIPEYQQFLSYMCPGYAATGVFPPHGTDAGMCPRPIVGVYDDHDSGWNNGNTRNPTKDVMKSIFLDAIGEEPDSPRRSTSNGLEVSYILPGPGSSSGSGDGRSSNGGRGGGSSSSKLVDEVRLILLDERYFRETLPCSAREQWCRRVLDPSDATPNAGDVAWCQDFLGASPGARGSCCRKDDEWGAWCRQASSAKHPRWAELCDPTSPSFAQTQLLLDVDNTTVLPVTDDLWDNKQPTLWPRLLEATSSPICEVLGLQQRQWLQQLLQSSTAALNIVASGSVLAGSIGYVAPDNTTCSGDDLACWPRAQVNLLHTLANVSGCTVLLTGDYHYSDLKVIQPGSKHAYARALQTDKLAKPVYQAMASGMTYSTAEHKVAPCEGSFRQDLVGLRPGGACSYVPQPAFGMLEVDWDRRAVALSIRNHTSGDVARGGDGSMQLVRFSLDTCQPL